MAVVPPSAVPVARFWSQAVSTYTQYHIGNSIHSDEKKTILYFIYICVFQAQMSIWKNDISNIH